MIITILATNALAQFIDPSIGVPSYGIDPPTVYAPTEGLSIVWPNPPHFPPHIGEVTLDFFHGAPSWSDPNGIVADTIVWCAWVAPSVGCDGAIPFTAFEGTEAALVFDADDAALDRRLRLYWGNVVGYDFEWTIQVVDAAWRNELVTYTLGACEGAPPVFGLANWIDQNCAFTEPRTFAFTENSGL